MTGPPDVLQPAPTPLTIRVDRRSEIPLGARYFLFNSGHTATLQQALPGLTADGRFVTYYVYQEFDYARVDLQFWFQTPEFRDPNTQAAIFGLMVAEFRQVAISALLSVISRIHNQDDPKATHRAIETFRNFYREITNNATAAETLLSQAAQRRIPLHPEYLPTIRIVLDEVLGPHNRQTHQRPPLPTADELIQRSISAKP